MKQRKILWILILPVIAFILFLLGSSGGGEAAILWGLIYFFLLLVIFLAGIIMLVMEPHRQNGLYLLLGVGVLGIVGFGVCSGFML